MLIELAKGKYGGVGLEKLFFFVCEIADFKWKREIFIANLRAVECNEKQLIK